MGAQTILTLEQFEALPEDDLHHELDEGELIAMPPPKPRHGVTQATIASLLRSFVEQHGLGQVMMEAGFILTSDPPTVRGPDIAFVRAERVATANLNEYLHGAPDLVVEIVSPWDAAAQVARKVQQYLRAGGHVVWVVYPEEQTVHVFDADKKGRILESGDVLEAPNLLPGFAVPVKALF